MSYVQNANDCASSSQADSHLRLTLAAFLVATSAILLGLSREVGGGMVGRGQWALGTAVEWLVIVRTLRPIVVLEVNTVGISIYMTK